MTVPNKLSILFICSETAPFAKTGGLADVTAALAAELKKRGHDIRVVIPFYACVRERTGNDARVVLPSMCVTMGQGEEWCAVRMVEGNGGVPTVFIEHNQYFGRQGLYHDEAMNDYPDNPRRFAFLSRAALQYCIDCGFKPDIVHAHDWQAALAPAYIKKWFWNNPVLGPAASALTIHNIAYQGAYPGRHYPYLGLGDEHFTPAKFESFGAVNFLKGGIYFSDVVNTVSPSHAREITRPFGGFGLAPFLADKGQYFVGILNGVDYSTWSPTTDALIAARYCADDLAGKAVCKRALQAAFNLERNAGVCCIAALGRFAEQKGFHLIRGIIENLLDAMAVQFVILGDGDNALEQYFGSLPGRYPGRAGSYIGYSDELSHRILAGADLFLMPSLFEPCGLTQMYALSYGTPPVVRATGGLDDTVEQYNERTGEGTGFKFQDATPQALYNTIGWAVGTFYDRPHHFKKLMLRAMQSDFSWKKSVVEYEKLYELALLAKKEYDRSFL